MPNKFIHKVIRTVIAFSHLLILGACASQPDTLSQADHEYYAQQIRQDLLENPVFKCNGETLTLLPSAKLDIVIAKRQRDDSKTQPVINYFVSVKHAITQPFSQFNALMLIRYRQTDHVWTLAEVGCVE